MGPKVQIDERALQVLRGQLGREPRGLLGIERRCRFGYPQVIKVYPLLKNGAGEPCPFPTLFWLTCPALVEQLSRLEEHGYIKELEQALAGDERLRREYQEDHRRYLAERWAALTEEDKKLLEGKGLAEALRGRGIGGLSDWDRVKCLHLHYAHHLARGSALGRWLESHFQLEECPPGRVLCQGFCSR
ncbi:MAG: DUF501 domain-containing protein [Candidatus Bipolaricaulia bacterium]